MSQILPGAKAALCYVADPKSPSGQPAACEDLLSTRSQQVLAKNTVAKLLVGQQFQRAVLSMATV